MATPMKVPKMTVPSAEGATCNANLTIEKTDLVKKASFGPSDSSASRYADSANSREGRTLECIKEDPSQARSPIRLKSGRRVAHTENVVRPLEEILDLPPSQWNGKLANSVYHYFKVQSYIVDPKYLLAVHIGAGEPLTPSLVTDYIWEKNGAVWSALLTDLGKLIPCYENCEGLTESFLSSQSNKVPLIVSNIFGEALKLLRKREGERLSRKLKCLVGDLVAFAEELDHIACHHKQPKENFFDMYFHALFSFFAAHTGQSIIVRNNHELELRLVHPKTKKSHAITCKPDFHIVCGGQGILVGEVKRVGRVTKSSEKDKHRGHRVRSPSDCPFKTVSVEALSGEDETLPDEEDETVLSDEEGETLPDEEGETLPDEEGETLPDEKGDTLPGEEGKMLPDEKGDALPGLKSKIPTIPSEDSGCPKHHYRVLNLNETDKMKSFLPQLVAGMLSSMFKNGKNPLPLGRDNENVQIGFSIDGFKLRFVRLVLRGPVDNRLPDVLHCLNYPDLHCDVFITQEYNLFKQKHLGMFYHMLVAMYHSAVWPI